VCKEGKKNRGKEENTVRQKEGGRRQVQISLKRYTHPSTADVGLSHSLGEVKVAGNSADALQSRRSAGGRLVAPKRWC
jgi:hypothetical protein